jgi:hypothetical protein
MSVNPLIKQWLRKSSLLELDHLEVHWKPDSGQVDHDAMLTFSVLCHDNGWRWGEAVRTSTIFRDPPLGVEFCGVRPTSRTVPIPTPA